MQCRFVYLILICVFILSGCMASTHDPREGGLLSYNPKAYEERIAHRKARKDELEIRKMSEEKRTANLEEQILLKQFERDALAKKITALDSDILQIEKLLAVAKTETDAQKHLLWKINTQLKKSRKDLEAARTNPVDTKSKENEVTRLENEIDRLLEEAEALSQL